MEMNKTYNPLDFEERIYKEWVEKGYFTAKPDREKIPFTIVMPPPNITGQLHIGHALDESIQDSIIRFKRMQGYEALWLPGTDHASIATEVKIVDQMKAEGLTKEDVGREGFLERAWAWKNKYGGRIVEQLKRLGSSCDWSKLAFTMDDRCSRAVKEVFVNLYDKGLIYQGKRIINWCPRCRTALSDAEVEYVEEPSFFWHLRYYLKDSDRYLVVATTRPETMFGDTAVAVNPKDPRYKDIVGKTLILPIVGREIPVIADDYVDVEFGTGAVKITPAHDPNDFEVGLRHNLPVIRVMDDGAIMNENAGKYAGMSRYECREAVVKELQALGNLEKIEPHAHNVGHCYRCHDTVEPIVSKQWFVKMEPLAKPAISAVRKKSIKFTPPRFTKIYYNWMENIKDWCISRQLWWGHRIPAYYCDDCGETVVAKEMPKICPKCGKNHFHQDEDTLDTWFSSALWPFSTLGWPDNTEEMEYFYPTDVLVTGYDIIFFWVIRMVFSALEQTGKAPFHHVLIHGLVRDSQGRKMSKSLGNGIDPLEVIDKYGADALRLTLMTGNAPGNDMRFYWERVESSRNFANKVWNASRFIMMNLEKAEVPSSMDFANLTAADKWILCKFNDVAKDVTDNMEKFELGIAVQKVYDFIWEEFCDWYIEMVKPRLYNDEDTTKAAALWTLKTVLGGALKLLHPYMPFITEEIYCTLNPEEESIMIASWPEWKKEWDFKQDEKDVEMIKEAVRSIRGVRTEMNVPPSKKATVYVVAEDASVRETFEKGKIFFATLASASEVLVQSDKNGIADDAVSAVIPQAVIYIPFAELVDIEKEIQRLEKEEGRLEKELARVNGMLSNERFISKAPQAKIDEEKGKLEKYTQMMEQVKERLAQLR